MPGKSWILVVLAVAGCRGDAADARFTPAIVASAGTDRGATPMFTVTDAGARVLSWVAPTGTDEVERLHVEVTATGGAVVASVLADPLGAVEPHGEAPPQVVASGDAIYALYTVGRDVGTRFPESAHSSGAKTSACNSSTRR